MLTSNNVREAILPHVFLTPDSSSVLEGRVGKAVQGLYRNIFMTHEIPPLLKNFLVVGRCKCELKITD